MATGSLSVLLISFSITLRKMDERHGVDTGVRSEEMVTYVMDMAGMMQ
jgi:hypothetical protein